MCNVDLFDSSELRFIKAASSFNQRTIYAGPTVDIINYSKLPLITTVNYRSKVVKSTSNC